MQQYITLIRSTLYYNFILKSIKIEIINNID